jgi:hypothetical protein
LNLNTFNNENNNNNDRDEIAAPLEVMKFPPLAYLLNCVLIQLNFLRECPLLTAKEFILRLFANFFIDICDFVMENTNEIKKKSDKYLYDLYASKTASSQNYNNTNNNNKQQQHSENHDKKQVIYLDVLYQQNLLKNIIPHILICFETIFCSNPSSTSNNAVTVKYLNILKSRNNNVNLSSDNKHDLHFHYVLNNIQECKEVLNATSFQILEHCWNKFI